MPKTTSSFICQQCGSKFSQYFGKCPECGTWNSLVETIEKALSGGGSAKVLKNADIVNLKDVEKAQYKRLETGIEEFDRVLGGGIVLGSILLISGDPGIGKSTLLTQLALNINANGRGPVSRQPRPTSSLVSLAAGARRDTPSTATPPQGDFGVLYVAGEESAQQIKLRADRISPNASLNVLNETDVDVITSAIEINRPTLVIVDSIQTLETQDLSSTPGSVGQVRECAHRLQRVAKTLHIPIILVGHVTKEGTVAGPRTLEHLVDGVFQLEGDLTSGFRTLRGIKNRFGSVDEVGVFEMEEKGLIEVRNPSKVFLDQKVNAPGSTVVATVNGMRAILVEIQALVTKTSLPAPRRVATGVDNNRLQLLAAVLSKRLNLPLYDQDIFVNVTGGLKIIEPAADLGICLAIISSFKDKQIAPKSVVIGEVGLLGELRAVRQMDKRANEAKKLGYANIISPETSKNLVEALKKAGI